MCSTPTPFVASEPIKIGHYIPNQEDQELTQRLFLLVSLKKRGRSIEYVCTSGRTCRLGTYQYPRFQWPMAEAGALCCNIKLVKKVSAYK